MIIIISFMKVNTNMIIHMATVLDIMIMELNSKDYSKIIKEKIVGYFMMLIIKLDTKVNIKMK